MKKKNGYNNEISDGVSGVARWGQVGARALGRSPWRHTSTLLQSFKNAF